MGVDKNAIRGIIAVKRLLCRIAIIIPLRLRLYGIIRLSFYFLPKDGKYRIKHQYHLDMEERYG